MNDINASLPVRCPSSVAELRDLVRRAAADGDAVYPAGGRTMFDLGYPATKSGIIVDLHQLNQVIDYPARDMTITVQAGITIEKLQSVLSAEKQRLPIDVPFSERATLGGAVACNISGPRRFGFGTLRDYVIGINAVNDRGDEIKAGGRVVKNVAGYDLCKLFTGSLGTLGIITQVTLKVRPLPQRSTLIAISTPLADLGPLLDQLHGSRTQPVCIDALSRQARAECVPLRPVHDSDRWLIFVGFEDDAKVVDWQVEQLRRELSLDFSATWSDAAADPVWRWLADYQLASTSASTFRANLLPSAVASFVEFAEPLVGRLHAHAGNGIVWGHISNVPDADRAAETVRRLREQCVEAKGNLVVTRCPNEWKKSLGVWGEPRGDWELMRTVKQTLDPKGIFNPGRFVDSYNKPS